MNVVAAVRPNFFSSGRLTFGGLLQHRQAEFLVENHAQLLRRAKVEFFPGDLERFALQRDHFVAQLDALDPEQLGIDERALALDARQHRYQRDFDVGQHAGQARNRA